MRHYTPPPRVGGFTADSYLRRKKMGKGSEDYVFNAEKLTMQMHRLISDEYDIPDDEKQQMLSRIEDKHDMLRVNHDGKDYIVNMDTVRAQEEHHRKLEQEMFRNLYPMTEQEAFKL